MDPSQQSYVCGKIQRGDTTPRSAPHGCMRNGDQYRSILSPKGGERSAVSMARDSEPHALCPTLSDSDLILPWRVWQKPTEALKGCGRLTHSKMSAADLVDPFKGPNGVSVRWNVPVPRSS